MLPLQMKTFRCHFLFFSLLSILSKPPKYSIIRLKREFIDLAKTIIRIKSRYKLSLGAKVIMKAVAHATGGTAMIEINKSRLFKLTFNGNFENYCSISKKCT